MAEHVARGHVGSRRRKGLAVALGAVPQAEAVEVADGLKLVMEEGKPEGAAKGNTKIRNTFFFHTKNSLKRGPPPVHSDSSGADHDESPSRASHSSPSSTASSAPPRASACSSSDCEKKRGRGDWRGTSVMRYMQPADA